MNTNSDHAVVLFDDSCLLCNRFVQLILRNDRAGYFKFAALNSKAGNELMRNARPAPPEKFETIVLIDGGGYYYASDAALKITGRLAFPWPLLALGWIFPRVIRDLVYSNISKNRYSWFGRTDRCLLPDQSIKTRFLENGMTD